MKFQVLGIIAAGLVSAATVASGAEISQSLNVAINAKTITNGGVITMTKGLEFSRHGAELKGGSIKGDGNTVSISASGAVAANSISAVNGAKDCGCDNEIEHVANVAVNFGDVHNVGGIAMGGISGSGNTVAISAIGAYAGNSISTVNGR